MPSEKGKPEFGPPPGNEVFWKVTHNSGVHKVVKAQTAFNAAHVAGWSLSECECEKVLR
jgi:hypothetical protein